LDFEPAQPGELGLVEARERLGELQPTDERLVGASRCTKPPKGRLAIQVNLELHKERRRAVVAAVGHRGRR
jgi:hypothetical protein